jgi:LytS/YehU family sensor histidine kinase
MGTHWLKAALSLPIVLFVDRFPLTMKTWKTGVPLHILALVLYTAAFIILRPYVVPTIYFGGEVPRVITFWQANYIILRSFLLDILYGFLVTILGAYLWQYVVRLRNTQIMQERLQTRLMRAELHALKMQLQPHFLFNTLHTISAFVLEDPKQANRMITRLSELLRQSFNRERGPLVTLEEELELLDHYVAIQEARFGDRLRVTFRVDPRAASAVVPTLLLQPLVENAVRHGAAPNGGVAEVEIAATRAGDRLHLEVRDNGPGLAAGNGNGGTGWGLGLTNTRARLSELYGATHRFDLVNAAPPATGAVATIEIPFSDHARDHR